MSDFASSISETLDKIGQEFLMGYYLPSAAFVLLHLFVIVPVWMGLPVNFSPTIISLGTTVDLDDALVSIAIIILLPVLLGMMLVALNSILIRLFEGKVWWLEHGLLYPLLRINRARNEALYGNLTKLRKAYAQLSRELVTAEAGRRTELLQLLDGLSHQIEANHEQNERSGRTPELPVDPRRITPTLLGNVYARIEEYAYQNYGMDAVLFWPRLRTLMHTAQPDFSLRITRQKVLFDLSLNFAFLAMLIAMEGLLIWWLGPFPGTAVPVILVVAGLIAFVAFYQSMVAGIRSLGESIKLSFDLHRCLILDSLGIRRPKTILEEKVIWLQLAAFLRRGEDFYYPSDKRL